MKFFQNFSEVNNTNSNILCLNEGILKGDFLVHRTNLLVCHSKYSVYETFMKQLRVFSLEKKVYDKKLFEIYL